MNFLHHFQEINLTQGQQNAVEGIGDFLKSDKSIFILQGFAGSGKTTLLKGLIAGLRDSKVSFQVMAPTGRAAKILRDKTGYGVTIHRAIYDFKDIVTVKGAEEDDYSFRYLFPIKSEDFNHKVLIIDETSMISSREAKSELYVFGSGILLDDILTYARIPTSSNKIIFVGDPAQLPPVGDNCSNALNPQYFETLNIKTECCVLDEVVRQKDNLILDNANVLRTILEDEKRTKLSFVYDDSCFIKVNSEDIPCLYSDKYPSPELGQGVVIAYSNSQCLQYNRAIRKRIFPDNPNVCIGDLLIVNNNNYHTYGVSLMNGEMVQVVDINDAVIVRKNIPVYETINGKRIRKHIDLVFRKVVVRLNDHPDDIECLIIDSLLNSPNRDLNMIEMKALYIDFVIRFNEIQKDRLSSGLTQCKINSFEFKQMLLNDIYFNALRVKYGYAITCHKSQGGEWETTFVDYYGRTSLKDDSLRWSYTATTRAIEKCFAANAPNVTVFSKLKFAEIQLLANIPDQALSLDNVPLSPYHNTNQHRAKSLKYWEVSEKLENSSFQIQDVRSLGGFQERYVISNDDEKCQFDVYHNNAGIFKDFQAVSSIKMAWHDELLILLNESIHFSYNVGYVPTTPVLEQLYGFMQSVCDEEDVIITNVEEKLTNYFVQYFLITDAKCAIIQFYFDGKGVLTRAIPKSLKANEDLKFLSLLTKLQSYVV
jgi:hypothetical protein